MLQETQKLKYGGKIKMDEKGQPNVALVPIGLLIMTGIIILAMANGMTERMDESHQWCEKEHNGKANIQGVTSYCEIEIEKGIYYNYKIIEDEGEYHLQLE